MKKYYKTKSEANKAKQARDGDPYGKVIWDDPACEDASDRDCAICVAYNIITEQ